MNNSFNRKFGKFPLNTVGYHLGLKQDIVRKEFTGTHALTPTKLSLEIPSGAAAFANKTEFGNNDLFNLYLTFYIEYKL